MLLVVAPFSHLLIEKNSHVQVTDMTKLHVVNPCVLAEQQNSSSKLGGRTQAVPRMSNTN